MSALKTLTFLSLIGVSCSQTSDCSYVSLLKHLNLTTSNDLAITRPVKNWTTVTLVKLDMVLFGILQVDEKFQTLTSHIWTQKRWTNEFLTWNPSDFCGIDMLTIPRSKLWIPDICIQEDTSDTGSFQNSPVLSVFPSGVVYAIGRQRLTSTCQLNLFMFPFDKQHCNFTFSSNHYADTMTLGTVYNDTLLTELSEQLMVTQGEWFLEDLAIIDYTEYNGSQSRLIYTVTISRKPLLYVINLIVPLFYFLVLDLFSFFISEARGEKLSFKVTILLSISVMLLILKDILPSTEDRLPMIASYCVVIFTMVGLSVLEAMLVSFLFDLDGNCEEMAKSSVQEDIQLDVDSHKEPAAAELTPEKSDCKLLTLILEEVKAARQEAGAQDKDKTKPGRYRRLANTIDSAYFAIYLLTSVGVLIYMGIKWVSQLV